ncbi:ABC transporter ATP-binding protein/permease [Patescibacteria group bacterium]|nr:ABC transporter ATP-binding protein/permease [Patescibacteria group bacterium]
MKIFNESRVIWQYLKKYKAKVYLITLIAFLGSFIAAVIPYFYGYLVDAVISKLVAFKIIAVFLLLWLILSLIGDWLDRIAHYRGYDIAIDIENDFRLEITNHLLYLPLGFHKNKKMGEIIQRASRGADHLETIISNVIFNFGPQFLTVVVALIIMSFVEWRLTSLLFLILVLYSLASVWKTRAIVKAQKKMNKVYEKSYGNLYDSIINIQTVKSFTREQKEEKRAYIDFRIKAGQQYKLYLSFWRDLSVWQQAIFSIGFVFIFGVAIYFLNIEIITPGQLVMFIGYISLIYAPFGMLANNYRIIRTGLTAIQRARKLLNVKPELYQKDKKEFKNIKGALEFININFSYQKAKNVLKDINFKVKPGQMVALVGESGVGKTTLIDLISRYYIPKQGKILIDSQDIAEVNLESLRKQIAIVPQEVTLFNDTIKNNIHYGRQNATEQEIIEASKIAHVHEFVQKFDKKYEQLVGERGIKLSTGQKQRVAIVRAILRNPSILILDEATSSLDSATEKLVQEALSKLIKGRTTFVIAHRLSTIQKADLILVLENGRIIEEGDHQELIDKGGVYKKLNQLQSTIIR